MNANESTGLRRVSLCATLALTSHAEFAAGVAAGLPLWHPWGNGGNDGLPLGLPMLLPVAIDCYVVDALERRRGMDRFAALGVLAISVIGGSAYVAANPAEGFKAAGVGVVLVLVLARLYATPKPSKAEVTAESTAKAERVAEEARRVFAERQREEAASRRRVEEATQLARIDADRVRADAEAAGLRLRAEADAEAQRIQAATDAELVRAEAATVAANAEAERVRAASDADLARVQAESTAELARIHAEAEANRPRATVKQSTNRPASRPRTAPAKPSTPQSTDAPSKDDAARMVASAIRAHKGPDPYTFEWKTWAEKHGGGRSFWFAAKAAAEQGPHLAKAVG